MRRARLREPCARPERAYAGTKEADGQAALGAFLPAQCRAQLLPAWLRRLLPTRAGLPELAFLGALRSWGAVRGGSVQEPGMASLERAPAGQAEQEPVLRLFVRVPRVLGAALPT